MTICDSMKCKVKSEKGKALLYHLKQFKLKKEVYACRRTREKVTQRSLPAAEACKR